MNEVTADITLIMDRMVEDVDISRYAYPEHFVHSIGEFQTHALAQELINVNLHLTVLEGRNTKHKVIIIEEDKLDAFLDRLKWQPQETIPRDGSKILACWESRVSDDETVFRVIWWVPPCHAWEGMWMSEGGGRHTDPHRWKPIY